MQIKKGSTRWVLLTPKYAIKLPSFDSYKNFLWGLLGNMQEKAFSKMGHVKLCPVLFSIPGGFLLIMPKCKLLTLQEYEMINFDEWVDTPDLYIPVENKQDSFGWYQNNIVAIDYGN